MNNKSPESILYMVAGAFITELSRTDDYIRFGVSAVALLLMVMARMQMDKTNKKNMGIQNDGTGQGAQ